ncbi:hypothetical protein [Halocatena marina]|uniref:YcxB-like protein domain-containing protein n=1 Tax=Halocatena marina TaxID=2934937 RepID=A0ABD5YYC9_9EURY|nr:hypothetical protein [Halocatena marina]
MITEEKEPMKDDSLTDVDAFEIGWGHCIVTEEEIHIEKDFKTGVKRWYEANRLFTLLVSGVLLYLVLSLIINRWIFSRIFAAFVFVVAIPISLLLLFVYFVYGFILGRKKNVINDSVIPLSAVEYVRFVDRPANGLYIVCVKNGTEYVAFVHFAERWYSVDEAMETAQTVFERRGISVHEE